jgi:hypothetical protein
MDLKNIDLSELSLVEQMKLYEFYDAYNRPYPPAMTWRDCVKEGLEKKEYTHCGLVEIQESMDELEVLSSFHLSEDGTVMAGESPRASWMDRKINAWSRREEWSL